MRTTITIDDHLLDALKRHAAERGTTVSRLIEDAVRLAAAPKALEAAEEFELVTFGRAGGFTPHDADKTSALLERDDVERYGGWGR
jgi:hypothetical protein